MHEVLKIVKIIIIGVMLLVALYLVCITSLMIKVM